jgi:acyloxyacyl hydrolase
VCGALRDRPLVEACDAFMTLLGPAIIAGLEARETPDRICQDLDVCRDRTCNLFPAPSSSSSSSSSPPGRRRAGEGPAGSIAEWLEALVQKFASRHEPPLDLDGDLHSSDPTFRGSDWRGRDCDDADPAVRPGREVVDGDRLRDSDCNGIAGVDPATGRSYEDLWCRGSGARGVGVLGDSVGAHFEAPPSWFNVSAWGPDTFVGALARLENEVDLPWASFTTGHRPNGTAGLLGPVQSLYLENRRRNLCSHRDYLNQGNNGERSTTVRAMAPSLGRNASRADRPLSLVLELVGNDVCSGHKDVPARFTPPAAFRANILATLAYLDATLPAGSKVLLMGLADGGLLWPALHNRTHPIGVPYERFFDYLNCLGISFCYGWTASNATVRALTTEWAGKLTAVLQDIAANSTWATIDVAFSPWPATSLISKFYSGPLADLIEPVDGFHPNQLANFFIAEGMIPWLDANFPGFLPAQTNPMNANIAKRFGEALNGY